MLACRPRDGGQYKKNLYFVRHQLLLALVDMVSVFSQQVEYPALYPLLVVGALGNATLIVLLKHAHHAGLVHLRIDTIKTMKSGAEISDINGNVSSKYGIICFWGCGIYRC